MILYIIRYAHRRLDNTMNVLMYDIRFSLVGSYPSSSSNDPKACFQIFQNLVMDSVLDVPALVRFDLFEFVLPVTTGLT